MIRNVGSLIENTLNEKMGYHIPCVTQMEMLRVSEANKIERKVLIVVFLTPLLLIRRMSNTPGTMPPLKKPITEFLKRDMHLTLNLGKMIARKCASASFGSCWTTFSPQLVV
jgi:hypothetical protein